MKGQPGHGSQPFRTDNALVKAAEVVRRIAEYRGDDRHPRHLAGLPRRASTSRAELAEPLLDPDRFWDALELLPDGLARMAHACTHTTDVGQHRARRSEDQRDPGLGRARARHPDAPGLGPRRRRGDAHRRDRRRTSSTMSASTCSGVDDGDAVAGRHAAVGHAEPRTTKKFYAGSTTIPMLMVGATDARFFRRVGRNGVRLRSVQRAPHLRGLRHDVPRPQRAGRHRVAAPVDRAVGSGRQGPAADTASILDGPCGPLPGSMPYDRRRDDPCGVLRLRRRDPVEPVRGVRALRSRASVCRMASSAG